MKALLLIEKINGFRDSPSVAAAHAAFAPAILRRFDAVIWHNVSGDVLALSRRRAFQACIGHVGVHGSAGDPVHVRLLEQAIAWAAGRDRRACGAGR